jgi:hypothetical protein
MIGGAGWKGAYRAERFEQEVGKPFETACVVLHILCCAVFC